MLHSSSVRCSSSVTCQSQMWKTYICMVWISASLASCSRSHAPARSHNANLQYVIALNLCCNIMQAIWDTSTRNNASNAFSLGLVLWNIWILCYRLIAFIKMHCSLSDSLFFTLSFLSYNFFSVFTASLFLFASVLLTHIFQIQCKAMHCGYTFCTTFLTPNAFICFIC